MKSTKKLLLAALLSIHNMPNALANPEEYIDYLFTLSLQDLTEIEISVASKDIENIYTAPGSITAYRATDIEQLGYYSLAELADITPGYGSTGLFGEVGLETRGQTSDGFQNQKHLILINGIPVNHARNYKAPVDNELPLHFANQVEFLRGPASALYGTSAFYGVVSIDPKTLSNNGSQSNLQLNTGSVDNTFRIMSDTQTKTAKGESSFAFSYYKKDASLKPIASEGETGSLNRLNWDDQRSLFMYANHQITQGKLSGLSIGSVVMSRESGLGELWTDTNHQGNEIEWWTFVPYIKFDTKISEKLSFKSYLKANYSREAGTVVVRNAAQDADGNFSTPIAGEASTLFAAWDLNFTDYETQLETRYQFTQKHSLISGLNYTIQYAEGSDTSYDNLLISADQANINSSIFGSSINGFMKSDKLKTTSLYIQDKYEFPVLDGLISTIGLRWDQGSVSGDSYDKVSPRLALVQKINPQYNIKLLWGNALRGPTLKDGLLNPLARNELISEGFTSDVVPQVEPETFETFELALNYVTKKASVQLTLFDNKTENEIKSTTISDQLFFINSEGEINATGYELEAKYLLGDSTNIWANYSQAETEDENGKQVNGVADSRFNLGLTYFLSSGFVGIVLKDINEFNHADGSDDLQGYTLVDFNSVYNVTTEVKVGLQIKNLFDEDYNKLSGTEQNIPGEERAIYVYFKIDL